MFQLRLGGIVVENIIYLRHSQKRFYSCSTNLCKKFKYALDPKRSVSRGKTISQQHKQRRKGVSIVDGKALTFFQFDGRTDYMDDDCHEIESPKQKTYAIIVQFAVESLFCSQDVPQEIQDCVIEIVSVDVDSSLTSAIVVWKLPDRVETKYTKEETTEIIERFIPYMKKLLPAHSTVTQTPIVQMVYDSFSEKQKEMDDLFEKLKIEELEYLERTQGKEETIENEHDGDSLYIIKNKKKKKNVNGMEI